MREARCTCAPCPLVFFPQNYPGILRAKTAPCRASTGSFSGLFNSKRPVHSLANESPGGFSYLDIKLPGNAGSANHAVWQGVICEPFSNKKTCGAVLPRTHQTNTLPDSPYQNLIS